MTAQPSLFDARARLDDRATSRAAGQPERVSLKALVLSTLDLLVRSGQRGATCHEITSTLRDRGRHVEANSVARRLTTLHRRGLVEPTGQTRPGAYAQEQTVWTVRSAS